ncbi:MAG: hypothetical protein M0C28_40425 [Candidatus Moduliflexus flocculans]|nr:hypothetical protein [Candidatus Moduliflexus flocculans]
MKPAIIAATRVFDDVGGDEDPQGSLTARRSSASASSPLAAAGFFVLQAEAPRPARRRWPPQTPQTVTPDERARSRAGRGSPRARGRARAGQAEAQAPGQEGPSPRRLGLEAVIPPRSRRPLPPPPVNPAPCRGQRPGGHRYRQGRDRAGQDRDDGAATAKTPEDGSARPRATRPAPRTAGDPGNGRLRAGHGPRRAGQRGRPGRARRGQRAAQARQVRRARLSVRPPSARTSAVRSRSTP